MISKVISFINKDVWRIRARDLSRLKAIGIRLLRIIILSGRGFAEDRCSIRASALTFYTLLSIVPVLAMAFGLAKGFGLEILLEKQIYATFQGQEEVIERVTVFARSLLENTKGGLIAGVGILFLFWTIISLLGSIEDALNNIWGIKQSRIFLRKISDYLSTMLISPVLLIVSSTATVVIRSRIEIIVEKISLLGPVSPAIFFALRLFPYGIIWVLFIFIYVFMPNTKINIKSGVFAGIIAGTGYQIFQWAYVSFQIGVAKYNAVYGSFAALPLFLIWLQVSWMILLFGAELSFAFQNEQSFEYEPDSSNLSYNFKKLLTLCIVHLLVKNFSQAEKPLSDIQIADTLNIPQRLAHEILQKLVGTNIVSEVHDHESNEVAYQPAQSSDLLTIKYVIDCLEKGGSGTLPVAETKEFEELSECLVSFSEIIEKSSANRLLKNI